LLFQGKTAEAEKIYNELANTIYQDNDTYSVALLDDFGQLEKAGVVPPSSKNDLERVKTNISKTNEAIEIYKKFENLCSDDKYDEAISLLHPFIPLLPKQHAKWASNLIGNQGNKCFDLGDYLQAEKYYLEEKNISEKGLRKEHTSYAISLINLGYIYYLLDDYAEAEKYIMETKNIVEKTFGKENPDYSAIISNLIVLYLTMKEYEKAAIYNKENCELITKFTNNNFSFLSERQRKQYWKSQEFNFTGSYSLSYYYPVPEVNGLNYSNTLFTKGLLLRTTNGIRDAIYSSGNKELISQFEQLGNLRQEINALQQKPDAKKEDMQALEKELPDVKTIYYSPSGLLHKIAFNALPTGKENALLSDKYNLYLVSSTREVAQLKKEAATAAVQDSTVVYGGLLYDARQQEMQAAAKPYQQQDKTSAVSAKSYMGGMQKRDVELPDSTLRGGFSEWKYLAGTKKETEEIVSELKQKRIPTEYYTGNAGNEESFKHLSGTKTGVIHLSTHGFFLPDIENKAVEDIVQRLGGAKEKPFENPLLRSGLIMSGANNQWLAKEYIMQDGVEDGILTADEISRLNLINTKLVVLSACETGLGDVKNSEGVFGLQRAFKLAGVESLIMSLWKVPDEATAELMTNFYQQWLSGQTKQNAFKTAQQKVREKYKSPYYWAAFVMMD